MVRMRYSGVQQAKLTFAALKPFRDNLIRMQTQCRPFGPDYLILDAVRQSGGPAQGRSPQVRHHADDRLRGG